MFRLGQKGGSIEEDEKADGRCERNERQGKEGIDEEEGRGRSLAVVAALSRPDNSRKGDGFASLDFVFVVAIISMADKVALLAAVLAGMERVIAVTV